MNYLLTWSFWFNLRPEPIRFYSKLALLIFILILLAAFVWTKITKDKGQLAKITRILADFCLANFIIGGALLFFQWQMVPFFAAKFWFLAWFLLIISWLGIIIRKRRVIRERRQAKERAGLYEKYLPK